MKSQTKDCTHKRSITFISLSRLSRAIASWWSSLAISNGVNPLTANVVLIREDFLQWEVHIQLILVISYEGFYTSRLQIKWEVNEKDGQHFGENARPPITRMYRWRGKKGISG